MNKEGFIDWVKENKFLIAGSVAFTAAAAAAYFLYQERSKPPASYEELMRLDSFDLFGIPTSKLKQLVEQLHKEMDLGLSGEPSSLKMLTSFVGKPTGEEKGSYYALDLGGTNFRVIQLNLCGNRIVGTSTKLSFTISPEVMRGTAEQLFDFIADCVQSFISKEQKEDQNIPSNILFLGFTFSFPVNQTAVAAGELIQWTKGFSVPGVEGQDVVALMNEAFKRKNVPAQVAALVNDTVGTMVTRCYTDSKCEMGVILGTGTNACYYEKLSNIPKFKGNIKGDGMIINMEWGAFGDAQNILPLTKMDKQLDIESLNPGKQIFEKLISGMYLGEIVRLVIVDLLSKGRIFVGTSSFSKPFETAYITRTLNDKSEDLGGVANLLRQIYDINSTLQDRQLLVGICSLVSTRAARLSGTAIAAVLSKIGRLNNVSVAIDGSVFEHIPGFKQKMNETIKELYPTSDVELVLTADGSGIGAAIIAATVVSV